ncbi:MAG TPA: hypothetical protein VLZ12_05310 [Verrucomicrobiae bacterium]|nr:hypothetical protein [Verrucomicrobiae bacterium]
MNSQTLRLTETNSADDSKGRTWGLEGNLFWYMTGGCFASVMTLLLLFSACRFSFMASLVIAAIPLLLTLAYIYGFRQGKPPGYDVDYLDFCLNGSGFGPSFSCQHGHPLRGQHVR